MTNTTNVPSQQKVLALLEKYAIRLFASLIFILSVILLSVSTILHSPYKDICLSVSTSLIASLIFSIIYSSVVEQHHLTVVKHELETTVRQTVDDIKQIHRVNMQQLTAVALAQIKEVEQSYYHQIATQFPRLIPSNHFPSTDKPDPDFNAFLSVTLKNSRQYLFKGVTGRHIPSRLFLAGHQNLTCKVLLADPQKEDLLRLYIRDRFGTITSTQEASQQLQKVKQEIYMTVVALFDQSRRTAIEIGAYYSPVCYRMEVFDEQLLISYYTSKTSTAYPETYAYQEKSFYYDAFLTDFHQTLALSVHTTTFSARSTNTHLTDFLTEIGCDPASVPQLREEAKKFQADFLKALGERIE